LFTEFITSKICQSKDPSFHKKPNDQQSPASFAKITP